MLATAIMDSVHGGDLPSGTSLGGYRIESKIRDGVYLATHPQLGRRVAVQVMRLEPTDEESSIERFLGVYIEHVAGAFPAWLAPEQVTLLPITDEQVPFAQKVAEQMRAQGLRVLVDDSNEKLGAKIRASRSMRHPFDAVIGKQEVEGNAVKRRSRDKGELGVLPVDQAIARIVEDARPPRV